jgi:hypothetical protein
VERQRALARLPECPASFVQPEAKLLTVNRFHQLRIHKDVPWAKICRLDEGQSGLRIVTEATDER